MHIHLKGTNLELSDSIKVYVNKKIGELERFVQGVVEEASELNKDRHPPVDVFVEVGRTTEHHRKGDVYRAEVNIEVPGVKHVLRAESTQPDLHLAIDEVKNDMQRQLKEYRTKRTDLHRRSMRKFKKLANLSPMALFRKEKKKRKEQQDREGNY